MSTTMRVSHHFDADVEAVAALMADPDFLLEKYAAIGATEGTIRSQDANGGAPRIVSSRKVTVDLPGFAKKVMTPSNTVVQTDEWSAPDGSGQRVCRYTVEVQGVPSRIDGTVTLRPSGSGGTTQDVVAEMKVSIPLLGGRLEKFAVSQGIEQLQAEAEVTAAELQRRTNNPR